MVTPAHFLLLAWFHATTTYAFVHPLQRHHRQLRRINPLSSSSYGKGADIWPPTNEDPILLQDSFPNGKIPDSALQKLQGDLQISSSSSSSSNSRNASDQHQQRPVEWTGSPARAMIGRILRRAAQAEETQDTIRTTTANKNKNERNWGIRFLITITLTMARYLRPADAVVLLLLTGYFGCLTYWAQSLRPDGITPCLPALPPTGHVPVMIANPIGYKITSNALYVLWLRLGVSLNVIAPLLWWGSVVRRSTTTSSSSPDLIAARMAVAAAAAGARPLLLACCQALTEVVLTQRVLTPLPIRILVPVLYNAVRLVYLWQWAVVTNGSPWAVSSFIYTVLHLFGFLLPVAVLKYVRAHVLGVEVEQATIRPALEDSVLGFSSSR